MSSLTAVHRHGVADTGPHGGWNRLDPRHGVVVDRRDPGWATSSLPIESSPILARVQRCTLKLEGIRLSPGEARCSSGSEHSNRSMSDASSRSAPGAALKRGHLLVLRPGTLFKRWKERYFLLTRDYLSCFRVSSSTGPTSMGLFLYKLSLAEMRSVAWSNSRSDAQGLITIQMGPPLSPGAEVIEGPLGVAADSQTKGRQWIQLKVPSGSKDAVLEDWFELIEENMEASKTRRHARFSSSLRKIDLAASTLAKKRITLRSK